MSQSISSWVVDWFSSRGKIHCGAEEAEGLDYLQSGLLNSLEIVEFVGELEDRFNVQFSDEEMQDPRFCTIGGIAELIQSARDQADSDQADRDRERLDRPSEVR